MAAAGESSSMTALGPERSRLSLPEQEAVDAAKRGDQHRLRLYLDQFDGDVNLRDDETQGTLLHVSAGSACTRIFHQEQLSYQHT